MRARAESRNFLLPRQGGWIGTSLALLVEEVLASLCTLNKMSEEASKVRKYGSFVATLFFHSGIMI